MPGAFLYAILCKYTLLKELYTLSVCVESIFVQNSNAKSYEQAIYFYMFGMWNAVFHFDEITTNQY